MYIISVIYNAILHGLSVTYIQQPSHMAIEQLAVSTFIAMLTLLTQLGVKSKYIEKVCHTVAHKVFRVI